jgi:hypothetical protein
VISRARIVVAVLLGVFATAAALADVHNLILFVPDGLRSQSVDRTTAPTLARLREGGVDFRNSHALFPTVTMANASVFATGHGLGDTGVFSNGLYTCFGVQAAGGSVTPFLEIEPVLREMNAHFDGNYLNESSIVAAAHKNMSTAIVGKVGPVAIFDLAAMTQDATSRTLIIDDATGSKDGMPLAPQWLDAIERAGLKPEAPGRGDNGVPGNNHTPGTCAHTRDHCELCLLQHRMCAACALRGGSRRLAVAAGAGHAWILQSRGHLRAMLTSARP